MKPLDQMRVLSLAINLPGPLAVARLHELGARVVKIEPPQGDPLDHAKPDWYRKLHQGQKVLRLDLKSAEGNELVHGLLAESDLLVTAMRPAGLERLGLGWTDLHHRYPRLCQVAIVGYRAPCEHWPGHDLTYQARLGLLTPPQLPRACIADLAGAQEAVATALGLVLARERGHGAGYAQVSLASAAEFFAGPLQHGLTAPGGGLGGGLAAYNLYRTKDGWIALAALEGHFWQRLVEELKLARTANYDDLQAIFATRSAAEWQDWAENRDLPLAAVTATPSALEHEQ
jgi:crotonobetainyl-CoA:carnitine CoA-transferase CaiB-like acyl-CoA transferase